MIPLSFNVRNPFFIKYGFLRNLYYGLGMNFLSSESFDNDNWVTESGHIDQEAVEFSSFYLLPSLNYRFNLSTGSFLSLGASFTYLHNQFGSFQESLTGVSFGTLIKINPKIFMGLSYVNQPLSKKQFDSNTYQLDPGTKFSLKLNDLYVRDPLELDTYFSYNSGIRDWFGMGIKMDLYDYFAFSLGYSNKNDLENFHAGIALLLGRKQNKAGYYFSYSPVKESVMGDNMKHTVIFNGIKIFDFQLLEPYHYQNFISISSGNPIRFLWDKPVIYSEDIPELSYRLKIAPSYQFHPDKIFIDTLIPPEKLNSNDNNSYYFDVDFFSTDSVITYAIEGRFDSTFKIDTIPLEKDNLTKDLEDQAIEIDGQYYQLNKKLISIDTVKPQIHYLPIDSFKVWWRVEAVSRHNDQKVVKAAKNNPSMFVINSKDIDCRHCHPVEKSIDLIISDHEFKVENLYLVKQDVPFIPSVFFPLYIPPKKLNNFRYYANLYNSGNIGQCSFYHRFNYDSTTINTILDKLIENPGVSCSLNTSVPTIGIKDGHRDDYYQKGIDMQEILLSEIENSTDYYSLAKPDTRFIKDTKVNIITENTEEIVSIDKIKEKSKYQSKRIQDLRKKFEEECKVNFQFFIPEERKTLDMKFDFNDPGQSNIDQKFVEQLYQYIVNDPFLKDNPGIAIMINSYFCKEFDQKIDPTGWE